MELSIWTSTYDGIRLQRLTIGFAIGAAALSSCIVGLALATPQQLIEVEEEIASFELAEEPAEQEEELVPEEVSVKDVRAPAGPRLASFKPPTEIPDDAPKEAEPSAAAGDGDPYAGTGGKARAGGGGGGARGAGPAKVAPRKESKVAAVAPPKRAPKSLTEDMTPPKPISMPAPVYPEHLKAQGVEGVVVMKYVVNAQGSVPAAQPVRGPMELAKACWEVMKTWRFEPARDKDGNPIEVTRIARFPFTIETG